MNHLKESRSHRSSSFLPAREARIFGVILILLMVVGSFWDLKISERLFEVGNWFGIFFAAYGELPAGLALVSSGMLLIAFRHPDRRARGMGHIVGGSLLIALGAAMNVFMPIRYLNLSATLVGFISILITAAVGLGVLQLSRGADRRQAIRVALVLLVVVVTELVAVNLIKLGWERPRMRFLATDPGISFAPWWSPGTPEKAGLIASGVPAEEFKSFPSGHAANAAVLLLLPVLVALRPSLARFRSLLFWVGAIWAVTVAASRVVIGAHFVTDTVAGIAITFLLIVVALRVAFPSALPSHSMQNSYHENNQIRSS